jgi:hypothetical protein
MKSRGVLPYIFMTGLILCLASILLAQSPPDRALFVNGKAAGTVTQVGGRSYVDLDTVAQITNGTFTVEPNRILLTIPARGASASATAAAAPVPANFLSKDFARSAITALAEMREWRGAIGTILTYGVPVVGSWPQDYHDHVQASLGQVGVAASTAGDQDALGLLRNQFENVSQWANGIVSARQAMDATKTVNPNYAANDPVLAKITSCNNFLNSMLVSGVFADNASCH